MLWPVSTYYEFIPLKDPNGHSDRSKAFEACDLEVGQDYKILLTTASGMVFPMGAFTN